MTRLSFKLRALSCGAILLSANPAAAACTTDGRSLAFGFYAFFAPLSYSAASDPPGTHRGYEADLLTALEAMKGAGLSFSRRPIPVWDDIWQRPARGEFDIVGGGITILDSRTRNAAGERTIAFTSGHVAFRQSLLVRAADAKRLAAHDDLTRDVRVGALAGTTGEHRLLDLTGLIDADGVLVAGVRIDTPRGIVVADGSENYFIRAAGASPSLADRRRLDPPSDSMPQVIYLGSETGEAELLAALRAGRIDAVARGEIGNREAASDGGLAVTALDAKAERGGFALAVKDAALVACLDRHVDWLTEGGRIGFAEWHKDGSVFMQRAEEWNRNR